MRFCRTRDEIHGLTVTFALTVAVQVFSSPAAAQQDCGDWSLLESPPGTLAVTNVEARSEDDAWAVAYFNPDPKDVIRWDGTTWSAFATDDVCDQYDAVSVEALDLVGASHVLVAARASTGPFSSDQLLLIWDGESWDNCNSLTLMPDISGWPRSGVPNVVVGAAVDDAWILGLTSGPGTGVGGDWLLTIHWDGSELTEVVTVGHGNRRNELEDAVVFASDDIWAVGYFENTGGSNPGFHAATYHWDGVSWNYVTTPAETSNTQLKTVAGVAPDDVWAAGENGSHPLFMHWDGSSWSIVPSPATIGSIYQMVAIASDDVWAVDYAGPLGKFYHWDGSSWSVVPGQEIPGAVAVERHGGLAAVGPCDLWAVGSYNFGSAPVTPLIERLQPRVGLPADIDGDGVVGFSDLVIMLAAWGPCTAECPADINDDGLVDFSDLLALLSAWSA